MIHVELQRQAYTEFGTLGRWRVLDPTGGILYQCLSAENPDRGNIPSLSCIPEGEYKLIRSVYHKVGYPCFQVMLEDGREIPGRTYVKVHRGNTAADVQGCIVLGVRPVVVRNCWGVGPSGRAHGGFTRFMAEMDRLEVQDCPLSIFFRKG